MYIGNNPTAQKSQRWIADALIELMKQKSYARITVRDICVKADLVRQTFYNCFQDKEEVLRFCLISQYEKLFQSLSAQETLKIEDAVRAFVIVLSENKELLNLMIQNHLDSIIVDEIAKCVQLFAQRFSRDDEYLSYSTAMFSGALAHLLLEWFKEEMNLSEDEIMQLISRLISGQLYKGMLVSAD